jgi:hypothetical protein
LLENNVSVADIAMIMELPDSKKNLQIRLARL